MAVPSKGPQIRGLQAAGATGHRRQAGLYIYAPPLGLRADARARAQINGGLRSDNAKRGVLKGASRNSDPVEGGSHYGTPTAHSPE